MEDENVVWMMEMMWTYIFMWKCINVSYTLVRYLGVECGSLGSVYNTLLRIMCVGVLCLQSQVVKFNMNSLCIWMFLF